MERRKKNRLGLKVAAISFFTMVSWLAIAGVAAAVQPQVAAGYARTVGLKSDGKLVSTLGAWDLSGSGWSPLWEFTQVAAGWSHVVGLTSFGLLLCTGSDGCGSLNSSFMPGIAKVAAGNMHSVILKSDTKVLAYGNNDYGQLNVGSWINITQVAGGGLHTVGLKADGTVVAVGLNNYGQLNVGSWINITQVAGGGLHTVGLKADGTVVAVGLNYYGQLNVGTWTDIVQVAAGELHTVGLKSDGTVVAVGYNDYGQLDVDSWTDIVQVAAGILHTVGLKSDGTVVAVGYNSSGQCNVSDWNLYVNQAPVLSAIGNRSVQEGELLEFTVSAIDPDNNPLTYTVSNLPPGASFDPATRTFSWTPGFDQAGTFPNVQFTVTDQGTPPQSDYETITITVGNVNRPPELSSIGAQTIQEEETLQLEISATDLDGDTLTYAASNLPDGAQFNAQTHIFTWTPTYSQSGNYAEVLFTVTDGELSDHEAITITVGNVNRPPLLTPIGGKSVNEGELLQFMITATDPDDDALTYACPELPTGAVFDAATQQFSWTPDYQQAGQNYIATCQVVDNGTPNLSDSETFGIAVGNTNRPPVLDPIGEKTVQEGQLIEFTVTGSDPDGNGLSFSVGDLPPWATFSAETRVFSGTPGYEQAGVYQVIFTVTDDDVHALTDTEVVTITVGDVNRLPVLQPIGNKSVDENNPLTFTIEATDPDGDALTYEGGNLPEGAQFDPAARTFSWTPTFEQAGAYQNVLFKAIDGGSPPLSAVEAITITVGDVNRPPTLNLIGNKAIDEGHYLEFSVSALDPDGGTLTYAAENLPLGAAFDAESRKFTWTPSFEQGGQNYLVIFKVADSGTPVLVDSEEVTITVGNVNRPPVLAPIGQRTVAEGETIEIIVTASDPDNDALSFAAIGLPDGATFDAQSQKFSWTPAFDQGGQDHTVTITVTDGGVPQLSDVEPVVISVANVNRPPVLEAIGNQSISEGETLSFVVSASDPDGDQITYSATNLPAGASFDAASRTFMWTPTFQQEGNYADIEFTATDSGDPMEVAVELITISVGNINRAPEFEPIGSQSVQENALLQFTVAATDPDGDAISYSTGELPAGASFDSSTHRFSWTPQKGQAGNYVVTFYAKDDGDPSCQGQLEVAITVGAAASPLELAEKLISRVEEMKLPKELENSYLANLKKVPTFISSGKITPAINQLEVFIGKVQADIAKGKMVREDGNSLMQMATELIGLLQ